MTIKHCALTILCLTLVGCQSFVNMTKTSPPYGFNEKTRKFADLPENRKFFLYFIETDLQRELKLKQEGKPPQDWGWKSRFKSMKKSQENPQFYINYFHRRRKELGLPPIPEIR